ncbi:hypothetical protein DYB32_003998 [Aphanomyces invadans]|uniref:Protein ENHANCED DISEASE RESISTANCE 2 C-terminal domain-containing protein n=1 Tax=Aphanomyces invadans TaxID=157072 RepID=A0A418AYU7_9STRA|nr:hypothetical protein DYB32_003998 [Aphanomyces invadans]
MDVRTTTLHQGPSSKPKGKHNAIGKFGRAVGGGIRTMLHPGKPHTQSKHKSGHDVIAAIIASDPTDHHYVGGYLHKVSDGKWAKRNWHVRWFVLDIDRGILAYYKSNPSSIVQSPHGSVAFYDDLDLHHTTNFIHAAADEAASSNPLRHRAPPSTKPHPWYRGCMDLNEPNVSLLFDKQYGHNAPNKFIFQVSSVGMGDEAKRRFQYKVSDPAFSTGDPRRIGCQRQCFLFLALVNVWSFVALNYFGFLVQVPVMALATYYFFRHRCASGASTRPAADGALPCAISGACCLHADGPLDDAIFAGDDVVVGDDDGSPATVVAHQPPKSFRFDMLSTCGQSTDDDTDENAWSIATATAFNVRSKEYKKSKKKEVEALTTFQSALQSPESPAMQLLQRFLEASTSSGDPTAILDRFKVIAQVVNEHDCGVAGYTKKLLTKNNATPVLTRPQHRIYHTPAYTEVDVDVHIFSLVARTGIHALIDKTASMLIDVAFVLQGESEAELPEQILGVCRLVRIDLAKAKHLNDVARSSDS